MDISTLATALISLIVIVWLSIRQTTWRPLIAGRALRTPLIVMLVGAAMTAASGGIPVTAPWVGAVAIELLLGAAVGAVIGLMAHLRPAEDGGRLEARNGIGGLLIWLGLIAVRIGLGAAFAAVGVVGLQAPGTILILLGVNRLTRSAVMLVRARSFAAQRTDAAVLSR
ncbi:hypothetical protein L2X99_16040 [Microbacterium sp. KUDC0406]|uniref:hypothetical protein n=1 Tax=Microbacterium sp. KUDC0406 TaxID=2909588 RepID=UPI001F453EB3|nr:hypothetical protein [Microbacterium sp. KUDC0406]UJP09866.1 hypothetical protein L2X99_16040 [Microbacterium sp. KUDC0406]